MAQYGSGGGITPHDLGAHACTEIDGDVESLSYVTETSNLTIAGLFTDNNKA